MWTERSFELNLTPELASQPADHTELRAVSQLLAPASAQMLNQLYIAFRDFVHFDRHHNTIAVVYGKHIDGVCHALFDTGSLFGWASSWINPRVVPVRIWCEPGRRLAVGDTAGRHMLAGQRRWRVESDGNQLTLATEAYERPRNLLNRIGMRFAGRDVQTQIWTAYLKNICEAHKLEPALQPTGPTQVQETPAAWLPEVPYPGCDCKI